MQGEDDGPQVLQADHRDVAVNPRDLRTEGQQGSAWGAPSRAPQPLGSPSKRQDLALDLHGGDAPRFPPHLLHPALGQAQVGLEVVAGDGQAQQAEADDGPEARGVVGRVRHAARRGGGCRKRVLRSGIPPT